MFVHPSLRGGKSQGRVPFAVVVVTLLAVLLLLAETTYASTHSTRTSVKGVSHGASIRRVTLSQSLRSTADGVARYRRWLSTHKPAVVNPAVAVAGAARLDGVGPEALSPAAARPSSLPNLFLLQKRLLLDTM